MPFMKKIDSILNRIMSVCAEISSILISIMMILVTGDVFGRYFLKSPIPGTLEITEMLMVCIAFLAYAYTEAADRNIKIGILDRFYSEKQKYLFNILASLIGILIFGIIVYQGWDQAWSSLLVQERTTGTVRLVLWPAKFVLVFGSLLLVVQYVVNITKNILRILS